jgi:hypothetical protein
MRNFDARLVSLEVRCPISSGGGGDAMELLSRALSAVEFKQTVMQETLRSLPLSLVAQVITFGQDLALALTTSMLKVIADYDYLIQKRIDQVERCCSLTRAPIVSVCPLLETVAEPLVELEQPLSSESSVVNLACPLDLPSVRGDCRRYELRDCAILFFQISEVVWSIAFQEHEIIKLIAAQNDDSDVWYVDSDSLAANLVWERRAVDDFKKLRLRMISIYGCITRGAPVPSFLCDPLDDHSSDDEFNIFSYSND